MRTELVDTASLSSSLIWPFLISLPLSTIGNASHCRCFSAAVLLVLSMRRCDRFLSPQLTQSRSQHSHAIAVRVVLRRQSSYPSLRTAARSASHYMLRSAPAQITATPHSTQHYTLNARDQNGTMVTGRGSAAHALWSARRATATLHHTALHYHTALLCQRSSHCRSAAVRCSVTTALAAYGK